LWNLKIIIVCFHIFNFGRATLRGWYHIFIYCYDLSKLYFLKISSHILKYLGKQFLTFLSKSVHNSKQLREPGVPCEEVIKYLTWFVMPNLYKYMKNKGLVFWDGPENKNYCYDPKSRSWKMIMKERNKNKLKSSAKRYSLIGQPVQSVNRLFDSLLKLIVYCTMCTLCILC